MTVERSTLERLTLLIVIASLLLTAGVEAGLTPSPSALLSTSPGGDGPAGSGAGGALVDTPGPDAAGPNASNGSSDLELSVSRVSACGTTCREVTAQLHNPDDAAATDVSVVTTVYAGDDIVWVDAEHVGTIPAGETYVTLKRIDLDVADAMKIRANGGRVRVETVIESNHGRQVSTRELGVG